MNQINKRIKDYIDNLGKNPNSYAMELKISATVIYNTIGGRLTKPSFDLLQKMLTYDIRLNADWLIMGRGSMLNPTNPLIVNEPLIKYMRKDQIDKRKPDPVYSDDNINVVISIERK